MPHPAELLLSRLDSVKGKYPKWMAKCPAHQDNGPSLGIKALEDGRILVHCFAGCGAVAVMDSLGLSMSDLFPDGNLGEFMSKEHRKPENRPSNAGYHYLQDEIYRLRAK